MVIAMIASSFFYAIGKDIEACVQDSAAAVVGAQLAMKLGFDIDFSEVLKKVYRNLIRIQDKLNKMFETLDAEAENEDRLMNDFMKLAQELELINGDDQNGRQTYG
jgi:hypothetical protein